MKIERTQNSKEYCKQLFDLQQKLKEYESKSEKEKEELRKNYGSRIMSEDELENETWKRYPLSPKYLVSNYGRVKFEGKIVKQINQIDEDGKEKFGYLVLDKNEVPNGSTYIYNFVAYTFLGKAEGDGYHVHHITNDGYDNSVENLVLLTKEEHSLVHGFNIG